METKTKVIIGLIVIFISALLYFLNEQENEAINQFNNKEALKQYNYNLIDEKNRIADSLLKN